MADFEIDHDKPTLPAFLRHRNGNGNGNGGGRGLTGSLKRFMGNIEGRVKRFGVLEYALVAAGGILVLDHLIAPKGSSYASRAWDKISPGHGHPMPLLPPPPPPPAASHPAAIAAAKGWFAGANQQAGWNRGMSPYGPWAVADPMRQYAHAAQRRFPDIYGPGGWYDWET